MPADPGTCACHDTTLQSPPGEPGVTMRRVLNIKLPERLSDRFPRWLTQAVVGIVAAVIFLALRATLEPLTGDAAPYALSFLAIVLACLVGGWGAGLVALALGQILTWYLLVPPSGTFGLKEATAVNSFLLATVSQILILLVIAIYQREAESAEAERERRIDFLGYALREIDHRTHNNFQTVMSLLTLQSRQAADPPVRAALKEAVGRVKAVSLAYQKLALSSEGLETVRLQDHLQELCDQLADGILPDSVELQTDFEPVTVPYEEAVCLGIIVNELVTNALKHAFPDGRGTIRASAAVAGGRVTVEVADDGRGTPMDQGRSGLGSRLIAVFVKRLDARHDIASVPRGTTHRIIMPLPVNPASAGST
jgi:two-component system, sensor histidine kinase PdtaS